MSKLSDLQLDQISGGAAAIEYGFLSIIMGIAPNSSKGLLTALEMIP